MKNNNVADFKVNKELWKEIQKGRSGHFREFPDCYLSRDEITKGIKKKAPRINVRTPAKDSLTEMYTFLHILWRKYD